MKYYITLEVRCEVEADSAAQAKATALTHVVACEMEEVDIKGTDVVACTKE